MNKQLFITDIILILAFQCPAIYLLWHKEGISALFLLMLLALLVTDIYLLERLYGKVVTNEHINSSKESMIVRIISMVFAIMVIGGFVIEMF